MVGCQTGRIELGVGRVSKGRHLGRDGVLLLINFSKRQRRLARNESCWGERSSGRVASWAKVAYKTEKCCLRIQHLISCTRGVASRAEEKMESAFRPMQAKLDYRTDC